MDIEENDDNILVNQDDIYSPTYKEVRDLMSKGFEWDDALFFLTEDKRISIENSTNQPESSVKKEKIDRCPRCGDPLFGGECILCD